MTSLMRWVRRDEVRRATSGVACATFLVAMAGCAEDRGSNAVARDPIAVTSSGIEIVAVTKNLRTVEAVVVAGGEERQVTLAPLLDGPLPSGMVATMSGPDGVESRISYGWDTATGATWVRQQEGADVLEVSRSVANGRVHEEYVFNDRAIAFTYADLPEAVASKAAAKFRRGEPAGTSSPDVIEFVASMGELAAFTARMPAGFLEGSDAGRSLVSLIDDPTFAGVVVGEDVTPNVSVQALCSFFAQCSALLCRINPASLICATCFSGLAACIALDWICNFLGCDCCFD